MNQRAEREPAEGTSGPLLAAALLGYFGLVTLVITLSPFDFGPLDRLRLSVHMVPGDILANVVMFLPLGVLLRILERSRPDPRWSTVWLAAAFSLAIECAQLFIRDRYVSPVDVASNTLGAFCGALLRDRLAMWAERQPQVVARLGLDLPLMGLIYLLAPQLWLSTVGLVTDSRRLVTTLLLGWAASVVLVELYRHRWSHDLRAAALVVPALALFAFTTAALPSVFTFPVAFSTAAVTFGLITWKLSQATRASYGRRFEVATLQRFLPIFCGYVVVATLWPPFRAIVPWHGAITFADRLDDASIVALLLLLEQVGGFTLLGYAAAEWRGRRELTLAADLPRVVLVAAILATLLELAQGRLSGPGASAVRALLAVAGAVYGAAVYHLTRAHVRAVRASHPESQPVRTDAAA